jgi:hypothetical protein
MSSAIKPSVYSVLILFRSISVFFLDLSCFIPENLVFESTFSDNFFDVSVFFDVVFLDVSCLNIGTLSYVLFVETCEKGELTSLLRGDNFRLFKVASMS